MLQAQKYIFIRSMKITNFTVINHVFFKKKCCKNTKVIILYVDKIDARCICFRNYKI